MNALSLSGIFEGLIRNTWIISARPPDAKDDLRLSRWEEVWPSDSLKLTGLLKAGPPRSPYPLIGTTLSLPGSRGEKLPERKADSFILAPLYSGSALTRWARTETLPDLESMSLARAAQISGAFISPNMGEDTVGSVSIVATLLNARSGSWIRNPRTTRRGWFNRQWSTLPVVLYLRELLGRATRDDDFVYLSDGGHFDELGTYELFRRRCRYIVAVSVDTERSGKSDRLQYLGKALRAARVDFGVEVEGLDLHKLTRHAQSGEVPSQFAVGRIRYPSRSKSPRNGSADGDSQDEETGVFVIIKAGLVGADLTADLRDYLGSNPAFPNDAADLQFDQAQFEAYRLLGYLAGESVSTAMEQAAPGETRISERFEALLRFRARPASDMAVSEPAQAAGNHA
jgi:hypothetical protein